MNNIWRYTWLDPKFVVIDYRASIFILMWILHPRVWTFFLAIGCIILLWVVEKYKGMSTAAAMRFTKIHISEGMFGNGLYPRALRYRSFYSEMGDEPLSNELNHDFQLQEDAAAAREAKAAAKKSS